MESERLARVYRAFSELVMALCSYLEETPPGQRAVQMTAVLSSIYQARIEFTRATKIAETPPPPHVCLECDPTSNVR